MLDVLKKDPKASFFFIGAEDEKDEPGKATRRFRVYYRFVSSVVSENIFEHHRNNDLSLYIIVNKKYVKDIPLYTQKITDFVSEAMNREWLSLLCYLPVPCLVEIKHKISEGNSAQISSFDCWRWFFFFF